MDSKQARRRLRRIWNKMRRRCTVENDSDFYLYGARGIKICNEWLNFDNFYNWATQNGYDNVLSIDRKNTNGNYDPSNCRWATAIEQAQNRRTNVILEIDGERKTISQWERDSGITTILSRLKQGYTGKELLLPNEELRKTDTYLKNMCSCNGKLTKEQVLEISSVVDNITLVELAKTYNVSISTIHNIKIGKSWSHITGRGN